MAGPVIRARRRRTLSVRNKHIHSCRISFSPQQKKIGERGLGLSLFSRCLSASPKWRLCLQHLQHGPVTVVGADRLGADERSGRTGRRAPRQERKEKKQRRLQTYGRFTAREITREQNELR